VVLFSVTVRALDGHYNTHLHFPRRGGSAPWHTIPTAARKFFVVELMMDEDLQALDFIIYFGVNILVLYHVHQSRLLEFVD